MPIGIAGIWIDNYQGQRNVWAERFPQRICACRKNLRPSSAETGSATQLKRFSEQNMPTYKPKSELATKVAIVFIRLKFELVLGYPDSYEVVSKLW